MIITLVKGVFICIYREGPPSRFYFAHCVKSPLAIIQMHLAALKLATPFYGDIPFGFFFFSLWPNCAEESFGLKRSLVRGLFFMELLDVLQWWNSVVMCRRYLLEPAQCTCVLCWPSFILFKGSEIISWTRLCHKKTMKHASAIKGEVESSRMRSITQDIIGTSGVWLWLCVA